MSGTDADDCPNAVPTTAGPNSAADVRACLQALEKYFLFNTFFPLIGW
jgi:hypothetical protein